MSDVTIIGFHPPKIEFPDEPETVGTVRIILPAVPNVLYGHEELTGFAVRGTAPFSTTVTIELPLPVPQTELVNTVMRMLPALEETYDGVAKILREKPLFDKLPDWAFLMAVANSW
jgi:hypothetical protein